MNCGIESRLNTKCDHIKLLTAVIDLQHGVCGSKAVPISQCTQSIHFRWEADMARLTRWGNSDVGLRLPKHILEAAGLRVGDEIGCRLRDDGTIVLILRKGLIDISNNQATPEKPKLTKSQW